MTLGLSILATLYPSWRAARLDPVEALALRMSGAGTCPARASNGPIGRRKPSLQHSARRRISRSFPVNRSPSSRRRGPASPPSSISPAFSKSRTRARSIIGATATAALGDPARTALRRSEIGFVYQFHHLLPEFSALENIVMPQMIAGLVESAGARPGPTSSSTISASARGPTHRPAGAIGGRAAARCDRPGGRQQSRRFCSPTSRLAISIRRRRTTCSGR